jgi:hypothetical protein
MDANSSSKNKHEGHIPLEKYNECMGNEKLNKYQDQKNNVTFLSNAKEGIGNKDPNIGKIVISVQGKTTNEEAVKIAHAILETKILEAPTFTVTANDHEAAIALAKQCQKDGITLSRIVVDGVAHEGPEAIKQFLALKSASRFEAVDSALTTPEQPKGNTSNSPLTPGKNALKDNTPAKAPEPITSPYEPIPQLDDNKGKPKV